MDKLKHVLDSSRKAGPPVPPRPSPLKVQQALEKTRQNILQPGTLSIVHNRTVIFDSTNESNNNKHVDHRLAELNIRKNCFDTECDDSSTGSTTKAVQNGNGARMNAEKSVNGSSLMITENNSPIILHNKSPVPRPRLRDRIFTSFEQNWPNTENNSINASSSKEINYQSNSYTNLLTRNQNSLHSDDATSKTRDTVRNHDNELKQKLLSEMMNKSNIVETSNKYVNYIGSNLKRASSFDALNESIETSSEKKVIFHEILISELSEMRRETSPRLNAAKSSPDIIQKTKTIEMDDKKSLSNYVCLEDSGVEDEGKMDDCSSGLGDSWDSCKDMATRLKMSLPGLPPLPKSLSGIELTQQQMQLHQQQINQVNNYQNILQNQHQNQLNSFDSQRSLTSSSSSSISRKTSSTLDTQLSVLRREMFGLRQLDLSLLSQLWALNESIQEFRTMIQEQENLSPQSPSPSNSDLNSIASDEEDDTNEDNNNNKNMMINGNTTQSAVAKDKVTKEHDFIEDMHQKLEKQIQRMRIAPPAPPKRPSTQSPSRPV